ncbi:MAG TPA: DUF4350 domain-containing protein [Candidatus Acidoferrales bacterium]|nr:DUF4350 domain-containing protein [Candidatus Acidoferrales bacterium]
MSEAARNWISATVAAGLLVVLALMLGALSAPRSPDPALKRPSTFFTDENGARALFLVMRRLLPAAEQWRRPLDLVPSDRDFPQTIIVAGPGRPISEREAEHLERWLDRGGQLILASSDGWPLARREPAGSGKANGRGKGDQAAAQAKTFLARHAPDLEWSKPGGITKSRVAGASLPGGPLEIQWRQGFSSASGHRVIAAAGAVALALEIALGEGRIVAIADPWVVSNRALRGADNAVWLVTLAGGWGNGKVLFDEFHHWFGKHRSATELTWAFLQTPWGWCAAQVIAAGLFYVFGYRRRFGRVSEPPPPARASPLELLEARARLFEAAEAQGLAADLIVQGLTRDLAAAYGRPVDLLNFGRNLAGLDRTGRLLASLQELLAKRARGEKLTDGEFVALGRLAGQIRKDIFHERNSR